MNEGLTTVWFVEDEDYFRKTIVDELNHSDEVECEKTFWDCESLLELLNKSPDIEHPMVLLLDINLPGLSGIEAIKPLKERMPHSQIIMLSIRRDTEAIYDALRAGASGYLPKNASVSKIVSAIVEASQGGMLIPAEVADKVLNYFATEKKDTDYGLSKREIEVLKQMADGYLQKEIADRLGISPHTVNSHIQNIYLKMHVRSCGEAVAKALREHIIL